jgi:hypothetical protein
MFTRGVATALVLFVVGVLTFVTSTAETLMVGKAAGSQFEPSDMSYLNFLALSRMFGWGHMILWFLTCLVLLGIWWGPIRKWVAAMAALTVLMFPIYNAKAFYEKTERTEAYTIMPNESAFWIPDVGDNKSSQAQLDSEGYLNEKKLAIKRFLIPHAKLNNSGGYIGWDYYVPSGRLIIVDRTPYSREWVDAEDRGTSKKKEGFPCQSKEGLNIIAGVSIGTSVMERDAAKFLYRFGVNPPLDVKGKPADRTNPEVIFTSVYYGRSLQEVMDDVGRKKVQTLVCSEITSRTFDQANAETNLIITTVEQKAREFFSSVGITLDFIGWGDTFEFDKDVQKAVNDKYMAQTMRPLMPVLEALAQLKVQEGLGAGLATKGLPMVITPGMIQAIIDAAKAK